MSHPTGYVRVPPDSTGKKVGAENRVIVPFDGQTVAITAGDLVTGATSGATGEVTAVETVGFAANTGRLYLANGVGTWEDGENIEVSASPVAVVDFATFLQEETNTQHVVVVDPDNPTFRQSIDRFGATVNTFTDGSPVFGPFGSITTGQQQVIKDYRFAYNDQADLFYDQATVGATVTYESAKGVILLTNPTTTAALSQRTSNFYHPYVPGVGTILEMTTQCGDVGKANVRRRWGLFDDNNGVYWELNGTTLNVVVRSNTTGSVVNTVVAQSAFNSDKLDGSDDIGFTLDVTLANIYFIDFQWLGAGRVKFGIFEPGGSRIAAHVVENSNIGNLPYMRTGTLPLRIEQDNTGTSGSSSEFRTSCAVIKHESKVEVLGTKFSNSSGTTVVNVANTDGELPVHGLRPKTTHNSIENHAIIKITSVDAVAITGGGVPVIIRVQYDGDGFGATAASWANYNTTTSVAQTDVAATAITTTTARTLLTFLVQPGEQSSRLVGDDIGHSFEIVLNADETTQPELYVTIEAIGTGNTDIAVSINWEELLY